jgi:hypothetical protein
VHVPVRQQHVEVVVGMRPLAVAVRNAGTPLGHGIGEPASPGEDNH